MSSPSPHPDTPKQHVRDGFELESGGSASQAMCKSEPRGSPHTGRGSWSRPCGRQLDPEPEQLAPGPAGTPSSGSRARAAPRAHAPRLQSPDVRDAGADTSSCAPPARGASAEASSALRRAMPPCRPRQHAGKRRRQRPVSLRQLRTRDLTLQHAKMVAQQQDLNLLLMLRTTPKRHQLEHPAQRPSTRTKEHSPPRHPTLPRTDPRHTAIMQKPGTPVIGTDRLLREWLGTPNACEAASAQSGPSLNWTRSACNRANAYRIDWQPAFARHSATIFVETGSPPPILGNLAHAEPVVALIGRAGLRGVYPHPNPDFVVRPLMSSQRALRVDRRPRGLVHTAEGEKERVALVVDVLATMSNRCRTNDPPCSASSSPYVARSRLRSCVDPSMS
jgi:hypothetical protein